MVSRRTRLPLVILMLALVLSASGTLSAKVKKSSRFSWRANSGQKVAADAPNCYWWCYYSPKEGSAVVDSADECAALCAVSCGGQCDQT